LALKPKDSAGIFSAGLLQVMHTSVLTGVRFEGNSLIGSLAETWMRSSIPQQLESRCAEIKAGLKNVNLFLNLQE